MIGHTSSTVEGNRVWVYRAGRYTPEVAVVSRHVRDLQPGDLVQLFENHGQLWVVAALGVGPVEHPPQGEVPSVPENLNLISGTEPVGPEWSGTWRGGGWRRDTSHLIQGDGGYGLSQGAAFYGEKLRTLGTLTGGRVRCERLTFGYYSPQAPTMRLLAGGKTGQYPAVLATAPGPKLGSPGSVGTFDLPADWLPRLASGEAGGIGIGIDTKMPYMRLDGPGFTLTVDWERNA